MRKTKNPDLALGPPIKFYNGDITLKFSERDHIYYLVGQDDSLTQVDGVTNTSGILDKSLYLMPWSCKMMMAKILQTMPDTEDQLFGRQTKEIPWMAFEDLVNEAKSAHKEKFEDAGDVGDAAHKWLEDYIRSEIDRGSDRCSRFYTVPEEERAAKCVEAALGWMSQHNVQWLKTESKVYSRQYMFAGTMDGLAEVDGELCIVDWKSSNHLRTEYLYQTAAYQQAIQEEFGDPVAARWILRLGKEDGKFEPWYEKNFEEDFTAFLLCLQLKRQHKQIERRMAEAKKARTARKKLEKTVANTI